MLNTLSGRFLILTVVFVMLAEIMIFLPSVARFREEYLLARLERAQIASLTLLASDMISADLESELLRNAGVFNVVLRRDEMRQLVLSAPIPGAIDATFDLRDATALHLIRDALHQLATPELRLIRVIGQPRLEGGLLIEITMQTGGLRMAMLDYALRILVLSALISAVTAGLLFLAVRIVLVRPIKHVVGHMKSYAEAPEDARRIIQPQARIEELRAAEEALHELQTELTQALRQKERLAQLGGAVARVSHDLRNILTSAQLFTDRIETSEDPLVRRMAPKLVRSITRAVNLCEGTLAFGKAEEPAPSLSMFALAPLVQDVLESEELATTATGLRMICDVPAGLRLRADPEQMHRVLTNLVRNARLALEAAAREGEIRVSARQDDTAWQIDVSDTGPGLPAKARENLFKPFQGGVRKGGTGLGLAIVNEVVRGHGGQLDLLHSDATGTCFRITLPMGTDV